jgi:aspartyl-tRNA(Asn)/glutamyl-tRNA(Gln) amidotransferase subunit A
MHLYDLTIAQASGLLARREISSEELVRALLARVEAVDPLVQSYVTVCGDEALDAAKHADQQLAKGGAGPLCGVPVAIKDVFCTQGVRTTCSSKILETHVPVYDATVVAKLKEAGAILLGKTNMDEFAMGASTENSGFFPTKNPWDLTRVPGGSSGGSAAAMAAGLCLSAIGTDTGGSIRQPASHCGVTGIKPTYGRVSRYGIVAFASSLDQAGPICRDAEDCALVLSAISGHDPLDSTSIPAPAPDYTKNLGQGVKGLRLGIPKEVFDAPGLSPEVRKAVDGAIALFQDLGAHTVEVSLPRTDLAVAVYYIIAPAEASSNLARYDGVKYGFRAPNSESLKEMYHTTRSRGFGPEVRRRILIGTYALSAGYYDAYYKKASQVRTLLVQDFQTAFQSCDAIISPVAPTPAFRIGERVHDPLAMYLADIFTIPANLAGLPALAMPCGFSAEGLPMGVQLMARHLDEETLFRAACAFQKATEHHLRRPPLANERKTA